MANHASSKKRIRQTARRTAVNRTRLVAIRTFVKRVEEAIGSGDKSAAEAAFKMAQPQMMRGVRKGIMPQNTASRKISRLSKRIKAISA